MRSFKTWVISPWFILVAAIMAAPPLLFSTFMPRWAPMAAIALLAVVGLLRCLAAGRVLGHTPADWPLSILVPAPPCGAMGLGRPKCHIGSNLCLSCQFGAVLGGGGVGANALASVDRVGNAWPPGLSWLWFFYSARSHVTAKLPFIQRDIYGLLPGRIRPFWNPAGVQRQFDGRSVGAFPHTCGDLDTGRRE